VSVPLLVPSNIPCLFDASLESLDKDDLQSGIGYKDDLNLDEIIALTPIHWAPLVERGFYFIGTDGLYFHSDSAVRIAPGNVTEVNLPKLPAPGYPISITTYYRDETGAITVGYRWQQKVRFSGTINHDDPDKVFERVDATTEGSVVNFNFKYADQSKQEFVISYNKNYRKIFKLPDNLSSTGAGVKAITLSPAAIPTMPFVFSKVGQFKNYTNSPSTPGDWNISSNGSTLNVYVSAEPTDVGYVTYYYDYPASILFSKSCIMNHGISAVPPTPQSMATVEIMGISNGNTDLCFGMRYFPVLKGSVNVYVDDGGTITPWSVVEDLDSSGPTDKECMIDPDLGLVIFGNGINGMIPPTNSTIGVVYISVPIIEYETRNVGTILGNELNMHPLFNHTPRGFLYLEQRLDILGSLSLSTNKDELSYGNDYAVLTCVAENPMGSPISNILIEFMPSTDGYLNLAQTGVSVNQFTKADGTAQVIYHPPSNVLDMAEEVNLYLPNGSYSSPYLTTSVTNDTLITTFPADQSTYTPDMDEVLTFIVVDNDPLAPYYTTSRTGGSMVLLYELDVATNNFAPVRPISVMQDRIVYGKSLPTPSDYSAIRKFVIVIQRPEFFTCRAIDPLTGRTIYSNQLLILLTAPPYQVGEFTLSTLQSVAGSAIGAATYFTIDKKGQLNAAFSVGGD
jgi:hypothetical protein